VFSFCSNPDGGLETSGLIADAAAAGSFSVFDGAADTNELCRVLIALNAIIPETATTWSSKTISNARESFMFGSDISS